LRKLYLFICLVIVCSPSYAHGFGGSGFLQSLTGIDDLLTMLAIGVWGAKIGGRAIYLVPLSFLTILFFGALIRLNNYHIQNLEYMIVISVVLLGIVITINKKIYIAIAMVGSAIFGLIHGFAYANELSEGLNTAKYITEFIITTLGLNALGTAGALLILERKRGIQNLRILGLLILIFGTLLTLKLILT